MNLKMLCEEYGEHVNISDYVVDDHIDTDALITGLLKAKKWKEIDIIVDSEQSSFEEQLYVLENGDSSQISRLVRIPNLHEDMQEILLDTCCAVDKWSLIARQDFNSGLHIKVAAMDCPSSNGVLLHRHEVSMEIINEMLNNENTYVRESATKALASELHGNIKI